MTWLDALKLPVLVAATLGAGCTEPGAHPVGSAPSSHAASSARAAEATPASGAADVVPDRGPETGGLSVGLSARPAAICPGECSTLDATVRGGQPPYAWYWDHDPAARDNPLQVCPSVTTSYSLQVEDTASYDLEFSSPALRGAASATVTVRSNCEHGGPTQPDAGADAETSNATPVPTCSIRIPVQAGHGDNPFLWGSAGSDAAGNLYLAAVLTGEAQVGPGPRLLSQPRVSRIFVAKYSAACEFQWVRWIGEPHETADFGSMTVSPEGQIALSRTYFVNLPLQVPVYRSQVLTLTRDGEIAWQLDSAGGGLFHTANMHGLAWGPDGALGVYGLFELCAATELPGVCVAKVDATGKLLFGRFIHGAMGAGVTLDVAGSLLAAGMSDNYGVRVDGLSGATGSASVYLVKFDASGAPQWLSTTLVDRDAHLNRTEGFVSSANDGSLLVAWNEVGLGPVTPRLVHAWRLSPSGAQRSLDALTIAQDNGSTEPGYVGTPSGELLTTEYINHDPLTSWGSSMGTTQLRWRRPDGAVARELDLAEVVVRGMGSVRLSPQGAPILVSPEYGPSQQGAQSALLVRRLMHP